jgi:tetratricopeptide (TPR) repeat protein
MENIDNFIADYWNDNLSAADRKIFEEKCATDNDFAKQAALHLELKKTAIEQDKVIRKVDYQKNQLKRKKERRGIIVLGIILSGIVAWFLYQTFKPVETVPEPAIYAQQYWDNTDKPSLEAIRGGTADSLVLVIKNDYENGNFENIIEILKNENLNISDKADLLLIRGIAYFEMKNFDASINDFQTYLDNDFEAVDEALWLQSLAFMRIDKTNKAISNWEIIVKEAYQYQAEATALIGVFK